MAFLIPVPKYFLDHIGRIFIYIDERNLICHILSSWINTFLHQHFFDSINRDFCYFSFLLAAAYTGKKNSYLIFICGQFSLSFLFDLSPGKLPLVLFFVTIHSYRLFQASEYFMGWAKKQEKYYTFLLCNCFYINHIKCEKSCEWIVINQMDKTHI